MIRIRFRLNWLCAALLTACTLSACHRGEPAAADAPAAALRAQVKALHDNDLVRFAELDLPPSLRRQAEAQWARQIAQAGPADEASRKRFDQVLARLTATDAEQALYAAYEQRMRKLDKEIQGQWPMLRATAEIFVKAAVDANESLDASDKAHAAEAATAVLAWARPELVTDRAKARQVIHEVIATARALNLGSLEQTRHLAWTPALQKGGVILAGAKRIGRIYGLDADAALAAARVEPVSADAGHALLRVRYPLLGQTLSFEVEMVRREGGWYRASAVHAAEEELAATDASAAAPAPAVSGDAVDALAR